MALPTYDSILDLLKKGAVLEAQEQFTAVHESALMRHQNDSRRHDHSRALEAELGSGGRLESDGIAYYLVENGKKSGFFCRRCYDTESRLVGLRALDAATYVCLTCKMEYARNLCG